MFDSLVDFVRQQFDQSEPIGLQQAGTVANHWLNTQICNSAEERNQLLEITCRQGVVTRPVWVPMHRLSMYEHCLRGTLENTEWAASHILTLPSSVPHDC